MSVPNKTPETATEIFVSQLPYVATQTVLEGTIQTVYFKITNDLTRDAVITFWFHGVNVPGNPATEYVADYEGFEEIDIINQVFDAFPNCATEVPILAGDSWWIRVSTQGAGTANPTLSINITLKPYSATFSDGQIVIFAASATEPFIEWGGLHAGFINPGPPGTIVNFIPFFPPAEQGDILNSGIYLLQDTASVTQPPATGTDTYLLLYTANFVLITRVLVPGVVVGQNFQAHIRTNNGTGKFWIVSSGHSGGSNRYGTVSNAGVISSMTTLSNFPFGVATVAAHAALNDETFLLLAPFATANNQIYKWNLGTLAFDGTIGTAIANYRPTDMLVLADDTIVISYVRTSDFKDTIVRRYNLAGAQLNTVSYTTVASITATPRLGYAKNPLYFWLWMPKTDGVSEIKKHLATDFSLAIDTTVPNVYETAIETPTPALIYVSDSCPIIETRITPLAGLIFTDPTPFTPGQPRRDVYPDQEKKIPNPTVRTALIGE